MRQLSLPAIATPLRDIRARLLAAYGPQRDEMRLDPTSQFVNAMISSLTRDETSGAAFLRLLGAFQPWDALADADAAHVHTLIHDVTHAGDKAVRLVAAAQRIRAQRGGFDLSFLATWPAGAAHAWLQRFAGAGPKVAAATLNFSTLRMPLLVADRHFLRLHRRLGALARRASFANVHRALARLVPDEWDADAIYEYHWLAKRLSQTICTAQAPDCAACPLNALCLAGRRG